MKIKIKCPIPNAYPDPISQLEHEPAQVGDCIKCLCYCNFEVLDDQNEEDWLMEMGVRCTCLTRILMFLHRVGVQD